MKKVLDTTYPIITTYTQHAHLLTILGNEPKTKSWVFSNYIQIYINKELNINKWGDYYFPMPYEIRPFEVCKWLEVQKNSEEFIDGNCEDIVKYVINLIDNNYYVHMMINYKYLSKSRYSKSNIDMEHDVLVYGYDNDAGILYCADFMFETSKYVFSDCTYDEFRTAYTGVKGMPSYLNHYIFSYRIKKECDYEYHIKNIVFWLKQYTNSEAPEYWVGYNYCNEKNVVWGISYYDILVQRLLSIEQDDLDIVFFYLLKDHKKIMIERLRFIESNSLSMKEYIEAYEEMYCEHTIIVNMVIKYNLSKNKEVIKKIIYKLIEIKKMEGRVLKKLINFIECYFANYEH